MRSVVTRLALLALRRNPRAVSARQLRCACIQDIYQGRLTSASDSKIAPLKQMFDDVFESVPQPWVFYPLENVRQEQLDEIEEVSVDDALVSSAMTFARGSYCKGLLSQIGWLETIVGTMQNAAPSAS